MASLVFFHIFPMVFPWSSHGFDVQFCKDPGRAFHNSIFSAVCKRATAMPQALMMLKGSLTWPGWRSNSDGWMVG